MYDADKTRRADVQFRVTAKNRVKFYTKVFLTMKTVETHDKKCGSTSKFQKLHNLLNNRLNNSKHSAI